MSAVMRDNVLRLQEALSRLPQIEFETRHHFADGIYCREMLIPKGATLVGKIHKREHFFLLTKGVLRVTTDEGVVTLEAPAVLVASPGTKRAGYAIEDCVCINLHRTESRDLDVIEAECIEPEELRLFDARNVPLEITACPG
jgi:quercetin dioxygenase-like cupin family protein